jgi:hypothetical protein
LFHPSKSFISQDKMSETITPTEVLQTVVEPTVQPKPLKKPLSEAQLGALAKARAVRSRNCLRRRQEEADAAASRALERLAKQKKGVVVQPHVKVKPLPNKVENKVVVSNPEPNPGGEFFIDWGRIAGTIVSFGFVILLTVGKTKFVNWWEGKQQTPAPNQQSIIYEYGSGGGTSLTEAFNNYH